MLSLPTPPAYDLLQLGVVTSKYAKLAGRKSCKLTRVGAAAAPTLVALPDIALFSHGIHFEIRPADDHLPNVMQHCTGTWNMEHVTWNMGYGISNMEYGI